jgi:hypothetical protein
MKLVFVVAALVACAYAAEVDTIIPETTGETLMMQVPTTTDLVGTPIMSHAEAVDFLQAQGKNACEQLADDEEKEVKDQVAADQKAMDALSDGSECAAKGQAEVSAAKKALAAAKDALAAAEKENTAAQNAGVDFGSYKFSSLKKGQCGKFFDEAGFLAAKKRANDAASDLAVKKSDKSAAEKALDAAIKEAARLKQECLCAAQSAHNVLSAAIAAIAADQKAGWAKAAHLKCALAGKAANACAVSATPVVNAKALVADAKNAQCGAGEPDKCKGQVVPATKGDNGVWFTWASPCSGGCSKATPQCGWGICSKEDWKGLPSAQMKQDKPCSSKIFDNKWGHCDPSNNFVRVEDGSYNELVFCYNGK